MKKDITVGIIGMGNIGQKIREYAEKYGWNIAFTVNGDGVYSEKGVFLSFLSDFRTFLSEQFLDEKRIDLVFLAIPTLDDGKIAYEYMRKCLEKNIPTVTCEKGALSNYFVELREFLPKIGYSATVGGGTRMLKYLQERMIANDISEIHCILNGTLQFIFNEISAGQSIAMATERAISLHYAEPGAIDPLLVIKQEAENDIPMKSVIIANIFAPTVLKTLCAKEIVVYEMDERLLKNILKEARFRRYIVSFIKEDDREDTLGGFSSNWHNWDWKIRGGFKNILENPLYSQLNVVASDASNAILIVEGKNGKDGIYTLTGPGAGVEPTVASMIKDAHLLLKDLK